MSTVAGNQVCACSVCRAGHGELDQWVHLVLVDGADPWSGFNGPARCVGVWPGDELGELAARAQVASLARRGRGWNLKPTDRGNRAGAVRVRAGAVDVGRLGREVMGW